MLLEHERPNEAHDGSVVWKDADDIGPPFDFPVEAFEGIRNRYDDVGAEVSAATHEAWRMVRPSGTEAPGARMCGQADL